MTGDHDREPPTIQTVAHAIDGECVHGDSHLTRAHVILALPIALVSTDVAVSKQRFAPSAPQNRDINVERDRRDDDQPAPAFRDALSLAAGCDVG